MKISDTFKIGQIFYSKWLKKQGEYVSVKVVSVDEPNDILTVDWGNGPDEWVLSHCCYALEKGEYSFNKNLL